MLRFVVLLVVVSALPSCTARRGNHATQDTKKLDIDSDYLAKLTDVPILLGASIDVIRHDTEQESIDAHFVYHTSNAVDDAVLFYQKEMERFGWNCIAYSFLDDAVLVFEKPRAHMVVTVHPEIGYEDPSSLLKIYLMKKS